MRIEYSEDDLKTLNFNYIVQINNHDHHDCIFDTSNKDFWIEKRIKFVMAHPDGNCFIGGYYYTSKQLTAKELVELLNKNKDRYYRLLNAKELEWFNNWQNTQREYPT